MTCLFPYVTLKTDLISHPKGPRLPKAGEGIRRGNRRGGFGRGLPQAVSHDGGKRRIQRTVIQYFFSF